MTFKPIYKPFCGECRHWHYRNQPCAERPPPPPMQSEPRKCIHGCTAHLATCGCFGTPK